MHACMYSVGTTRVLVLTHPIKITLGFVGLRPLGYQHYGYNWIQLTPKGIVGHRCDLKVELKARIGVAELMRKGGGG